jgi:mono/diheme cytochrome c family protein
MNCSCAYFLRRLPVVVVFVGLAYAICCIVTVRFSSAVAQEAAVAMRPDESQVARGRYLIRTTGCNDCHTPGYIGAAGNLEESQWLTGDASLGFQGPWGTTYPANLRQLMQRLSVDAWTQYARRPTRPPMPWFALRDMNDEDLAAIYAFVRSLGPSEKMVPAFAPPGTRVTTAIVKFPDQAQRGHARGDSELSRPTH